jgi:capsular exopolysaccharide synthesis family protein
MSRTGAEAADPRDFLNLLRRRGWILLVCLIVLPVAAYFYTDARPKVFQASTLLQVESGAVDASTGTVSPDFSPPPVNISAVASFVSTSAVADEAARQLGMPRGSLNGVATAAPDEDTGFITLSATGPTSKKATEIANAFASALNATRAQRGHEHVRDAINSVNTQLSKAPKNDPQRPQLEQQRERLRALDAAQSQNLQVLQRAEGAAQIAPHPRRNATIAIFLAILIGIGLIALSDRLDRRIHKPEDIEKLSGVPFLATIPEDAFEEREPTPVVTEAFQTLRNTLTYFNVEGEIKSLIVVSSFKGEGKTTAALNLAISYANFGKRVILVDTDLRKPHLATRLGAPQRVGLGQVLSGSATLDDAIREVTVGGNRFALLPGGPVPPNASALLGSNRMKQLLTELTERADVVILDSTPLLVVSDTFPLLDQVSGIVPLVRLHQTPHEAIRRMMQICTTTGGRVLGVVATGGTRSVDPSYGHGYGYGYGEERKRGRLKKAPAAPAVVDEGAAGNGTAPDDVALEPRN